jgi:flagellar hook-associated protein 1 FlgK
MSGDILSIGKSALFAAQAGLATTGHNISNANVAGYSRQVVVQATTTPVEYGSGFFGTGTQVAAIKRYSDEFLNTQVRSAQASASALETFNAQISQVDNMLADSSAGLSPALQSFFKGVQDMAGNHGSVPSRQSMLSSAQTLAGRFQSMDGRLQEIRDGVNSQIETNITLINSYAQQIAGLNDQITNMGAGDQHPPNDLLDKRDQLVLELNQHVKATVTQGDGNNITVSIGAGMPLVVGKQAFELVATGSPTDLSRTEVGLQAGVKTTVLGENSLQGGELGGLLDFRANVLDRAQNELGKLAVGLAATFNAQHKLGLDDNGQPGADFFSAGAPAVTRNIGNATTSTTTLDATISDPSALTGSDYRVDFDGTDYSVTRLSDNKKTPIAPFPQTTPQTIDGVDFAIAGSGVPGDNFLVRPTIHGASQFKVAVTDTAQIAAAGPVATNAPLSNTGTATISAGSVDAGFLSSGVTIPMTISYDKASGTLAGFDPNLPVTVTVNGSSTTYPAWNATVPPVPVPYATGGATYRSGGVSFTISAGMQDKDQFSISGTVGNGDVRNANLLGALQSTNIFDNKNATYQSSYAKLVSFVGNKARESQVNGQASDALLAQVTGAQQSVSGVNLDEEATNLLRYQQAYQAAGKVMQIASTVFDALLSIGH